MAGLGEVCSHIAALLFAAEAHNHLKDTSCTSQRCAWLAPNMQNVAYAPIPDIDFTAPATKRKRVHDGKPNQKSQPQVPLPPPPSKERIKDFIHELSKTGKPALLSILPGYCDEYVMDHSVLSLPLSALFDSNAMELPYCDLLNKCEEVFESLTITNEQARNIEASTRDQAQSKTWFRYRAGRVTASKFKAVRCLSDTLPPQPLDTKDMTPCGVVAIKNFTVLWCL